MVALRGDDKAELREMCDIQIISVKAEIRRKMCATQAHLDLL